jgi:hypothetical protein
MKKSLKNLKLKKAVISNFDTSKTTGGSSATVIMCNSVPRWQGGIGCHLK